MAYPQDLADFLLARITEEEAIAQAAAHGGRCWISAPNGYDSGAVEATDGPRDDVGIVVYDEGRPSGEQAAHIAYWDPARMFAECEAKRRLIDWDAAQPVDRGVLPILAQPYAWHPDYDAAMVAYR